MRLKDVARIELGSQIYNMIGRSTASPPPSLPCTSCRDQRDSDHGCGDEADGGVKAAFPGRPGYVISLDTTLAVREGINEIIIPSSRRWCS